MANLTKQIPKEKFEKNKYRFFPEIHLDPCSDFHRYPRLRHFPGIGHLFCYYARYGPNNNLITNIDEHLIYITKNCCARSSALAPTLAVDCRDQANLGPSCEHFFET